MKSSAWSCLLVVFAAACAGKPQPQSPASQPAAPEKKEEAAPAPTAGPQSAQPAQGAQQAQSAPPAKPEPKADPNLPPRRIFSGNPDYTNVQVSPDGKYLSYLAAVDGVLNVWLAPIDQPEKAAALTSVKDRPLRNYFWAYDGKHVLYMKDKAGDENFHLYEVDVKTKDTKDLTDLPKVRAFLVGHSHKHPNEVVVGLNDRDERYHDLYKVDLKTGKRTLLEKNEDGYAQIYVDDDFQVRMAQRQTPDGGTEIFEKKKGKYVSAVKVGMEDALTTAIWGFDASGKILYVLDSRGRNTSAAFAIDTKTDKKSLIAEDPRADLMEGLFHPKTGLLQAVSVNYDKATWKILDKSLEPDFDALKKEIKGELVIRSRSLDDKRWIVIDSIDDGPARYYRYDRDKKKLTFLFVQRKEIQGLALAHMNPVVIKARDGMDLVSYLSLPRASDPEGHGKPDHALPMVLLVHGGPWGRDSWGFDPAVQWLASRGYAVLKVNYRGSVGFGKSFINAANGEWAGKMHDDLLDAVDWAVKSGVADKDKVAIYGGSYGGYSTLVGLTFTPDTFACGVDIVGPSNLITLLNSIPPYWAPVLEMFVKRIGDHRTEEGRKFLASRSPLTFADRIKKPLLIGQGKNDPRVKQAESDQIVKAMQEKKIPVTYAIFSDEGHGFARPENRLAFDAVAEPFLAQCLGGTYQPVGMDFAGSSIEVPTGSEYIVGLGSALAGQKAKAQN